MGAAERISSASSSAKTQPAARSAATTASRDAGEDRGTDGEGGADEEDGVCGKSLGLSGAEGRSRGHLLPVIRVASRGEHPT
ncbi:hypothetical protein GCM10010266_21720 [Streptomyces griseomycini]|nr:hypothetical protein GCM10010266_21720 [Streptomyces griseomycini]GGR07798.1 hypothetical protein GCM10015536_11080 [Streptomyces griseomycini]